MLISLLVLSLFSNTVTLRRDKSILFSRIVIIGLILTSFLAYTNLYIRPFSKGLGICEGLINLNPKFSLFIFFYWRYYLQCVVILQPKFFNKTNSF